MMEFRESKCWACCSSPFGCALNFRCKCHEVPVEEKPVNIPDEELWGVFQTVYEPGSRTSLASAERDQPDIIDGARAVAEWARKEALREAADAIEAAMVTVEQWQAPSWEIGQQYALARDGVGMALDVVRALVGGDKTDD